MPWSWSTLQLLYGTGPADPLWVFLHEEGHPWAHTPASPGRTASPAFPHRKGPKELAISGSVVGPGNQNDLLINPAEGLQLSVEGALGGPHDQDPVFWSQELQDFGKLLFQALGFTLGERGGN